ncbi:LOW QUALITY PROTEIN: tetraspanin-36-like [Dromiciops gliroides]|uniref:LOW QUALITY PROTEIN: tetraspanin-36-like n=1 Tax=Dromiciops gliroides TaxID=33562 RepID=UPI001CC6B486|nr:LOW QUALITY PROTEIN: tetraspanin-36-like [Dromiciops gliroides]
MDFFSFRGPFRFLGLLLWGAAAAMAWAGVSALRTHRSYQYFCDNPFLEVLGCLVVSTAPLLLITGGLAVGISRWNTGPWQGLFLYGVVVLLCMEASSVLLAHTSSCQRDWETHMLNDLLHHYGNKSDPETRAVDRLQEELQCCGIYNYTDWGVIGRFSAPTSCCQKIFLNCTGALGPSQLLYQEGCLPKLEQLRRLSLAMYSGAVLGLWFWSCLLHSSVDSS